MYHGFSGRSQGDWNRNMVNDSVWFAAMASMRSVKMCIWGEGGQALEARTEASSNVCSHGSKSS